MHKILFLALNLSFSLNLQAQQVWKDYIIGRPIAGYGEAKSATAKEWGINYESIYAGCVISDKVTQENQDYQKQNKSYFATIESTFGKDWMRYFNLEVQKKMNLAVVKREKDLWLEPVLGKPHKDDFKIKKAVAQKWGIQYKVEFLGSQPDEASKTDVIKRVEESSHYINQLNARFGDDWKKEFDREVQLEIVKAQQVLIPKEESTSISKDTWVDLIVGKPDAAYYKAKKILAQEWGIQYYQQYTSSRHLNRLAQQSIKIDVRNEAYFAKLTEIYGQDWKVHFEIALQKMIAKQLNKAPNTPKE